MQTQTGQHASEVNAAARTTIADIPQRQTLYTVEQFAIAQPAFTAPAIRNLIFKAEPRYSSKGEIPGNGLLECGAVIRVGRKVLIDAQRFLEWVSSQQSRGARCKR